MAGKTAKNYEIEILRGIAVLLVICEHLPFFMPWHPFWIVKINSLFHFWSGVDLFFCISGFVIMNSVQDRWIVAKTNRQFMGETAAFWMRRFFRLSPAAWTFLTLSVILSALPHTWPGAFGVPGGNFSDMMAAMLYVANFHVHQCAMATPQVLCGNNAHYWSLSLEEQFYFFLPFLIFLLRKRIWILCAAAIIIQFPFTRPAMSMAWLLRTDSICWGILIAMATRTELYWQFVPTFLRNPLVRWPFVIGLFVILCWFTSYGAVSFNIGMIAIICAILVSVASFDKGLLFANPKSKRVLVWIGARSYSLYLSHAMAFWIVIDKFAHYAGGVNKLDYHYTAPILVCGLALGLLMAEISYRFIETPLRRKGHAIADRFEAEFLVSAPSSLPDVPHAVREHAPLA